MIETEKYIKRNSVNATGGSSNYVYNVLGTPMENIWVIAKNGYSYHDVNKLSTNIKQFVLDYTTETYQPLTEHEINGLDSRYYCCKRLPDHCLVAFYNNKLHPYTILCSSQI